MAVPLGPEPVPKKANPSHFPISSLFGLPKIFEIILNRKILKSVSTSDLFFLLFDSMNYARYSAGDLLLPVLMELLLLPKTSRKLYS